MSQLYGVGVCLSNGPSGESVIVGFNGRSAPISDALSLEKTPKADVAFRPSGVSQRSSYTTHRDMIIAATLDLHLRACVFEVLS